MLPFIPFNPFRAFKNRALTPKRIGVPNPEPDPRLKGEPPMRTRALPLLVTLGLVAIWPVGLLAQVRIRDDGKPLPLTPEMRAEVVAKALKELDDAYVFPDVAAKMRKYVEERVSAKEYDGITTGQALAKQLTADLQAVSKDRHIRVNCSTEPLPERPKGPPPADMLKRMREHMKFSNSGFRKVERLPGNVGYVDLRGFTDHEAGADTVAAAFNFLANTDALIFDLRKNGGGSPKMVQLICSYLFDETPVHLNSLYWRKGDRTEEFWTLKEVPGKRYLGKDVYILTSAFTFSGAEEFTYNLKNLKRATVVGETTGGGAHPGGGFPINDHFIMFVPTGRAINPITKTNWEGTGVSPDVAVPADQALEKALELAIRRLEASKDEAVSKRVKEDLEMEKVMERRIKERIEEKNKVKSGS
jgi:hypothetical protein